MSSEDQAKLDQEESETQEAHICTVGPPMAFWVGIIFYASLLREMPPRGVSVWHQISSKAEVVTWVFQEVPRDQTGCPWGPQDSTPQHKWKKAGVAVRFRCRPEPWEKEKMNKSYLPTLNNSQDLPDKVAKQRDSQGVDLSQQHHTIIPGWQQMIAGHSCDPVPKGIHSETQEGFHRCCLSPRPWVVPMHGKNKAGDG